MHILLPNSVHVQTNSLRWFERMNDNYIVCTVVNVFSLPCLSSASPCRLLGHVHSTYMDVIGRRGSCLNTPCPLYPTHATALFTGKYGVLMRSNYPKLRAFFCFSLCLSSELMVRSSSGSWFLLPNAICIAQSASECFGSRNLPSDAMQCNATQTARGILVTW